MEWICLHLNTPSFYKDYLDSNSLVSDDEDEALPQRDSRFIFDILIPALFDYLLVVRLVGTQSAKKKWTNYDLDKLILSSDIEAYQLRISILRDFIDQAKENGLVSESSRARDHIKRAATIVWKLRELEKDSTSRGEFDFGEFNFVDLVCNDPQRAEEIMGLFLQFYGAINSLSLDSLVFGPGLIKNAWSLFREGELLFSDPEKADIFIRSVQLFLEEAQEMPEESKLTVQGISTSFLFKIREPKNIYLTMGGTNHIGEYMQEIKIVEMIKNFMELAFRVDRIVPVEVVRSLLNFYAEVEREIEDFPRVIDFARAELRIDWDDLSRLDDDSLEEVCKVRCDELKLGVRRLRTLYHDPDFLSFGLWGGMIYMGSIVVRNLEN